MKIQNIELLHIAIPCLKPFETSFGVVDHRPALIIRMAADNGLVGYGESSPLYTPISESEIVEDAISLLRTILPKLIGIPIEEHFDIHAQYADPRYPVSLIGIEAAYLDLVAKSKKMPVSRLLGASRTRVMAGESVGLQSSIDAVLHQIEQHLAAGLSRIKVKIARERDIEIVRAVRAAFPSLYLGVDANAAFGPEDIGHLSTLKEYDLAFVEQPFQADDYRSHAILQSMGISICLDETIRDIATCHRAVEESACSMINIKPARIGSFAESRTIHDYCVEKGIKLFGGGRLETGIGKTMNAAFYALPGFTEASDITPPRDYLAADIITPPFEIQSGEYLVPQAPGLGVEPVQDILEKYIVEQFKF